VQRALGIAAGLGAAAIWGGMYVVTKYVLAFVPPLTLVLFREFIGALTLTLPTPRLKPEFAPLVRDAARRLSLRLGSPQPSAA